MDASVKKHFAACLNGLCDIKATDRAWQVFHNIYDRYKSANADSADTYRMRYDALWMMRHSLIDDAPLAPKSYLNALDILASIYEEEIGDIVFQLSCHEEVRVDAMNRVKFRSENRHIPAQETFSVPIKKICEDMATLQKDARMQPYLSDLQQVSANQTIVDGMKAEYKFLRERVDDFEHWREGSEFLSLFHAYEAIYNQQMAVRRQTGVSLPANRVS
jgi:hypothetical protein